MTTEEILVIDTHQYLFLITVELVERVTLIDGDTRMQPSRTLLVFHHQHFAMQVDQAVADVMHRCFAQAAGFELFLIAQQTICPFLYLHLRVKLRLEPIYIAIIGIKCVLFCPFRIKTKDIA